MRKYIFIFFMGCLINKTQAQIALLDKVYDFIQSRELQKAESAILLAEKHITTANDARTYYLKAFIYKELFLQTKGDQRDLNRSNSLSGIAKCKSLDHDSTYKIPLRQLADFLKANTFNEASDMYNNELHDQAIAEFKKYLQLGSNTDATWLDAHYFIGSSFYALHQYDSALKYYEFVRKRNYNQPILYVDLGYLYLQKQDEAMAFQLIKDAEKQYPDYYDIQVMTLNIFSGFNKHEELVNRIEKFLVDNPNNIEVLLLAATTYMKTRTEKNYFEVFDKAEASYQRIIAIEPYNYEANYNLGVLYYNEAVDIVNKNDLDTDLAQLSIVLEKSTGLFEKALPLLVNIYDPKKPDIKLLQALQAIYYNLNMKDKLSEVNALLKNLQAK